MGGGFSNINSVRSTCWSYKCQILTVYGSLLYQNMLDLTTPTCPESAPPLPQAPKPEDVFGSVCCCQTHP